MVLSKNVRMTEEIRKREFEVREAVAAGAECPYLYCLTLPSCEKNLLDIHPYRELRKRKEYDRLFVILGLAENRKAAVSLVFELAQETAVITVRPEDYKQNFITLRDRIFMKEESK